MVTSQALEVLIAAKPLIEEVKASYCNSSTSWQEYDALETIEQALQAVGYSKPLLNKAGWDERDLAFLHSRLVYYHYFAT